MHIANLAGLAERRASSWARTNEIAPASFRPGLPPSQVPASRHHEKGSERGRGREGGRPTKASLAMPPAAPFVARRSAGRAGIYAPSCSGRRRRDVRTWIGRPTAGAGAGGERVLPLKQRRAGGRVGAALSLALFVLPRALVWLTTAAMRREGQETRRASRTINATRIIVRRKERRKEGRGEDEMGERKE